MAGMKNMLCLDPASSHLAYTISEIQGDELYIKAVGMIWTKAAWSRGQRYLYMDQALDTLIEGVIPEYIIDNATTEAYFVSFANKSGIAVIPTINGFVEKNCAKYGVGYSELSSSSWRGILGVKGASVPGQRKKDYKTPTKHKVEEYIGKVPDTIISNVTLKPRGLPHDLTDALAITIAKAQQLGVTKVVLSNSVWNPVTVINKLNKLAKEIK